MHSSTHRRSCAATNSWLSRGRLRLRLLEGEARAGRTLSGTRAGDCAHGGGVRRRRSGARRGSGCASAARFGDSRSASDGTAPVCNSGIWTGPFFAAPCAGPFVFAFVCFCSARFAVFDFFCGCEPSSADSPLPEPAATTLSEDTTHKAHTRVVVSLLAPLQSGLGLCTHTNQRERTADTERQRYREALTKKETERQTHRDREKERQSDRDTERHRRTARNKEAETERVANQQQRGLRAG